MAPRFISFAVLSIALICVSAQAPPAKWGDILSPEGKAFDMNGENFDILSKLARFAGLAGTLTTKRHYTLFAPNDAAFVKLARYITPFKGPITDEAGAYTALVDAVTAGIPVGATTVNGTALVSAILLYHASDFVLPASLVTKRAAFIPMLDKNFVITTGASAELVDKSPDTPNPKVIKTDISVEGGVTVHVINAVLLPVPVPVAPGAIFCA